MGFRDLLAFLTRLPLGGGSLEGAAESFYLAPLAGLLVGAASALAGLAGSLASPGLGAAFYLAAHVLLTGGLHLDGLADLGDVYLSGARGDGARRLLKDPRKGAGAIILVATVILLQYAGASTVLSCSMMEAFLLLATGHALSYEAMYLASYRSPPPPYRGLGRVFHDLGVSPGKLAASMVAVLAALAPALALHPLPALAEALGTLAAALLVVEWSLHRLGYASGDVLGAVQEAGRAGGLAGAALCLALC